MRRILVLLLLLTLPLTVVLSQVSVLKQIKATFKNGDVATLEKQINKALQDSVTMKMAETWNYAGRIQQKKSAVQMEKAYLRKPYDTLTIYNCALNMSKYFLICDSLAQKEMKPGKINKYRKDSQKAIVTDKGNLLNGGIYFYNQAGEGDTEKLSRSLDFFKTYIDLTVSDMFKDAYKLPIESICKHEFVFDGLIDDGSATGKPGATTLDVAKRLLDYGFHAPTIYFPLLFHQALMIEPTETESKETLDLFIEVMHEIAREAAEDPDLLHSAPHLTPISRPDETTAARNPILKFE